MATILSRKINVAMKLGNRQDLLQPAPGSSNTYSRISGWLRDAYISVAYSNTFEQAEQTLNFSTTEGQDSYVYPQTVRAIKAFNGYRPDNTPIQMGWKDIDYIRRYNSITSNTGQPNEGVPCLWTFFANSIILRPVPDNNGPYTFFMDCWMKPQITTDVDSTILQVPDDWLEVIDYEAAVRGHAELQESDKSRAIQTLLYGFVDPQTGKFTQGIEDKLSNRRQASAPYVDYGLQPKRQGTGRYNR